MKHFAVVLIAALTLALVAEAADAAVSGTLTCQCTSSTATLYTNETTVAQTFAFGVSISPTCTSPSNSITATFSGAGHNAIVKDNSSEVFTFTIAAGGAISVVCNNLCVNSGCGLKVQWSLEQHP